MQDFIKEALLRGTVGEVYVCSLPNAKDTGEVGERNVATRDVARIEEFKQKWDRPGRGLFFCVSTMQPRRPRNKSNAVQTAMLHVDTDAKDLLVSVGEAVEALSSLELPPSRIHASGHGVHSYWLLDEPTGDFDLVENLLRRLSTICGGDPLVAHRAALMRMPGSHNTKNDEWKEVEVLSSTGRLYSIIELQEWAERQWAVVPKKGTESNPFLEAASSMSYRPPVDVQKRLAAMTYQGEGETSVHTTQLSVTASMLSSGVPTDDVVSSVLEATKRIGDASWDWNREEANIRRMCEDWLRKQTKKTGTGTGTVVQMSDHRPKKEDKKSNIHTLLGQGIMKSLEARNEALVMIGEQVWKCSKGLWRLLAPGEVRVWLDREAEEGCRALSIPSTQKIVGETRSWVLRSPEIGREKIEWDNHGKIPTLSGVLDPSSLKLSPILPEHYTTYQIEASYEPGQDCPNWKRMTKDIFRGDDKTISVVQEIFGMALLDKKPRSLMRALVLVGPSNSGKSNVLSVLGGLISSRPNTTTFDTLENAHGLMEFLRRAPWVLHEAFDQSKWHFSAIVKALLSGDPINVNVKNGPIITHSFRSPVFWGTNSPPQFKEASRAIENRLKIVQCHMVFSTESPDGVAADARIAGYASPAEWVLATERSGILNWAIEGMQRAMDRGHFLDTEEMVQSISAMRTDSNIVAGFIDECCQHDPQFMVSKPDFHAAFSIWWKENRGEDRGIPSIDSVGRAITALYDSRIAVDKSEIKYKNLRYIAGVRLNDVGIDLWTAYFNTSSVRGDSSRISSSASEVNTEIPSSWDSKGIIQKMREAHKDAK